MTEAGGAGRGWRSAWAIFGALVGAAIGIWLGYEINGVFSAISGFAIGGLVGWVIALFLRGMALYLVLFFCVLSVTLAWNWLTGSG